MATAVATAPVAASAVAGFPFSGNLSTAGMVQFTANQAGGVNVDLDLTKLPKTGGDFTYQIHEQPVAWNSNHCDGAGPLFDPFNRGAVNCDSLGNDELCAVGDLSGKHGKFHSTCYQTTFADPYVSLDPQSPAYIVGRSLVVFHNGKPLACATIAESTGSGEGNQLSIDSSGQTCEPSPEEEEEEAPEGNDEEMPEDDNSEPLLVPEVPEMDESSGTTVRVSVMAALVAAMAMM